MSQRVRNGRRVRPYDVVAVGAGIAGLAAALEASSLGARTLLVEASDTLGGAARISGGGICVAGTDVQRALGIDDDPATALRDWASWGGPDVDLPWAEAYLRSALREVYDWLADLGVDWVDLVAHEGNSRPRWHRPAGAGQALVGRMVDALGRTACEVRLSCPVTGIDTAGGRVLGVSLADGTRVGSRAVVVATGGFVDHRARLGSLVPLLRTIPRWLCGGIAGSVGAGLDLLLDVGAQTTNLDAVWCYPIGTPDPRDPSGSRGLAVRGLVDEVWVNSSGRRFHDEDRRGGATGTPALLRQPGATSWGIFDDRELAGIRLLDNAYWSIGESVNDSERTAPWVVDDFTATSVHYWTAPTVAGLEAEVGLPPGSLVSTINAYNAAVRSPRQVDPEHGRDLAGRRTIEQGPFHAIQYFPIVQKNLGGIRTDGHARVLDADGRAIAGLYAAGELTGMAGGRINGRAALEGTMLGPCVFSGRAAGHQSMIDQVTC